MSDKITPEQLHELIEAMNGRRDRERNEDKYLEKFGEGLKSADPMVRARALSDKNAAMAADNYKDALKSGKEALKGFHSALLDTSTGLTKYEHGVKNLGDATSSVLMNLGPLGKVAALAVQGLTALSGAILKQTQNMVGAYDEMAKVGGAMGLTADSIKEYGAQAQFTTHNLKVFAKAAAESSDSLVALGGSVSGGMKKFSEFTAVGDDTLKQYRRMGMTQEDVLAAQQQYIKYQSAAGASLAKSPKELQKASLDYIDSLNKLADITGNSVKKQQEALDFAAQQENWNAYKFKREIERDEASKRGDKDTADKIDRELKAKEEFIAGTADLSQKDRGALLESIARSGAAVITENNSHLVNAGIQIDKITGNLAKGESQVIEYRSQNAEAQKNLSKQYGDGLTAYGSASRDLQKVVGADNEARRAAMKDQALLTKEGRAAAEKKLKDDIAAKKEGREGQGAVDTVATVESAERKYRSIEDAVINVFNPFTGSTGKSTLAVIALGVAATGTAALMAKSVGALGSLGGGLLDKLKGLGKGAVGAATTATTAAPAVAKTGTVLDLLKPAASTEAAAGAATKGATGAAEAAGAATKGAAGAATGAAEGAAASSAKALASSAAKGLGRIAGPLAGIIAVADGLDTAATGIKQANKDLAEGKISQKDATVQKSGAVGKGVGQAGGGVAGALAGAAIGTAIFPVVGTAIGAALGGWLGSKGGEKIGESVGEIVGDSISTDVKDIKKDLKNPDEIVKVSVVNPVTSPANVSIVKGLENLKQLSQPTSTLTTKVSDTVLPKNINDLETTIDTLNKSNDNLSSIYKAGIELDKLNNDNLASIYKTVTSEIAKASSALAAAVPAATAPVRRDGATQRQNLAASMPGEGSKGVIPTTAPTVSAKPAAAAPASAAAPAAKPAAPIAAPSEGGGAPSAAPVAASAAGGGRGGQGGASAPTKMPSEASSVSEAKAIGAETPSVPVKLSGAGRGGQGGSSAPSTSIPTANGELEKFAKATGAGALAANITKFESGKAGYNAYNRGTVGNKMIGSDKPIDFSKMTISEYLEHGKLKSGDPDKIFAMGKYQIIPSTMEGLAKKLKLDTTKTFLDSSTQDLLFNEGILKQSRQNVAAYLSGKSNDRDAAILDMAKEFASVGVPYPAGKATERGQSFYAGVGGNKAHNPPEAVGAALDADRKTTISAKDGGITSGPMTGYPATLHGNEMITPLTPNSILEQLAKTVAEPSGAASAGTDDASAILKEMRDMQANFYAMMESKFTDMVDNLEESVDVQQNILQQSMT